MDLIRKQQINEVLESEININKVVFNMEKRNVALSTDNVLPYSQLNYEAIDTVSSIVNALMSILEKKKSDIHNLETNTYHNASAHRIEMINDLSRVEDVLKLYNSAVEPYLGLKSSLTQQTKGAMWNRVRA